MTSGYSKRPLLEKLGIKPGYRVLFLDTPPHYSELLGTLPANTVVVDAPYEQLDFIHFFTKDARELTQIFPELKEALSQTGMLWISWPKGSSKVKTDLNENIVRDIGLSNNMVDIKVCAVDEIWSGLKFVYRVKDRDIKK